jgi:hypothetical protein
MDYLNATTWANYYNQPIKSSHFCVWCFLQRIESHANVLTTIQCTGPKHHIKIVLSFKYSLLLFMATHLGNVAHQHVDIYTRDNNKSLTMSIITLEMLLSTKDAYTHE